MEFFFWVVYTISALAAFYHSFRVFELSDPWYVALLSAFAIDGVTFFAMAIIGRWKGNQRVAGFIGVFLFALISGLAQIIWRYHALGIELPEFLRVVSLALVPLSTTGAVVVLGLMHYFGSTLKAPSPNVETTIKTEKPSLKVEVPKPVLLESPPNGEVKRGPGRPKTVFAKTIDPKA